MNTQISYKPVRFYIVAFLVTWLCEFVVIYLSYREGLATLQFLFIFAALFGPLVAAWLAGNAGGSREWRKDFWSRFGLKAIQPKYLAAVFLILPGSLLLATAISLLFGRPADQFQFSNGFNTMGGQGWFSLLILILAPTLEEMGWHGYGVDSIKSRFDIFKTTLLFSALWAVWHLPLFFIKGYYHYELWQTNIIYAINWFAMVPAQAALTNWVYFKNNRSITACILLHIVADISCEMLQTEQFTKCILTVILLAVDAAIILRNKEFFFGSTTVRPKMTPDQSKMAIQS